MADNSAYMYDLFRTASFIVFFVSFENAKHVSHTKVKVAQSHKQLFVLEILGRLSYFKFWLKSITI